jgi:hypothetical protein
MCRISRLVRIVLCSLQWIQFSGSSSQCSNGGSMTADSTSGHKPKKRYATWIGTVFSCYFLSTITRHDIWLDVQFCALKLLNHPIPDRGVADDATVVYSETPCLPTLSSLRCIKWQVLEAIPLSDLIIHTTEYEAKGVQNYLFNKVFLNGQCS